MVFFWILLYGAVFTFAEFSAIHFHAAAWLTPIAMTGYAVLLILWIVRTGQSHAVGLTVPSGFFTDAAPVILLLFFPVCNLLLTKSPPFSLFYVLLTLSTCTTEELFFRGFFLSALKEYGKRKSVIFTALAFSLLHLSNLLSSEDWRCVLVQMISSFAAGLSFGLIRLWCGSLLPCIASHTLTNLTAGSLLRTTSSSALIIWCFCIGLSLVFSFFFSKKSLPLMEDNS